MSIDAFMAEAKLMKNCRHEKVVHLYGVCLTEDTIYIIMELVPHGSLLNYLRGETGKNLCLGEQVDMAAQVNSIGILPLAHKQLCQAYKYFKSPRMDERPKNTLIFFWGYFVVLLLF